VIDHREKLLRVLKIAVESSRRGRGLSMQSLLAESEYCDLRTVMTRAALVELLESHSQLIDDWLRYSEDKRTTGGRFLRGKPPLWEVGRLDDRQHEVDLACFPSASEACAEYVLRELDFWQSLTSGG
jgi:hypothetical protein